MHFERSRPCPCGSQKHSWFEYDARGIPLTRVCDDCRAAKLSKFRREVLTDSNYEHDEHDEEDSLMIDYDVRFI